MHRETLRPLTSLRFFAALLVFAVHSPATARWALPLSLGHAGVGFFFLLSGFILTVTYYNAFAPGLTRRAARAFYAARFARIYPLHLTTMALMLLVLATAGGWWWNGLSLATHVRQVVPQLALLQSWTPNDVIFTGANPPSWSISDEAFFYACFPLLAWLLAARLRRASSSQLYALAALAVAALTLATLRVDVRSEWLLYGFPPVRLLDFIVGMLLGLAYLRRTPPTRALLRPTSVEILAVGAVAVAILLSLRVPASLRFCAWLMPWWAIVISVFARQAGALSRLLAHPAFVRLGEASYAFYLVHLAVIQLFRATIGFAHPLAGIGAFALTLGVSFALYAAVEQPLRVRLRTLLAPPPRDDARVRVRGPATA